MVNIYSRSTTSYFLTFTMSETSEALIALLVTFVYSNIAEWVAATVYQVCFVLRVLARSEPIKVCAVFVLFRFSFP